MKIIVGAGGTKQEGWFSTEQNQLDITEPEDFHRLLGDDKAEAFLAEHLFEHICPVLPALKYIYQYLQEGGYLRLAVPDGFHADPGYIEYVSPPMMGHCDLYNYKYLGSLLKEAGFRVELLEWWDEFGKFNAKPWNEIDGYINRCLANDLRNKDGKPHYTSLIIDAWKDGEMEERPSLEKAFDYVSKVDRVGLSPYGRRKAYAFYELARLAPKGNVIEMGCFRGVGTVPIFCGAQDGNKGKVIAIDSYTERHGWIGEPYGAEDEKFWRKNMEYAGIEPKLIKGECVEISELWTEPVAMMMFDLGKRDDLLSGVLAWEKHFVIGGLLGIRDIDDFSNGTEESISALINTGRWGKRIDWPGFITSVERIT
jgi:predicted SAM-dependent methyltransferase